MKIPIQCRLCQNNFGNQYCEYNEKEDNFIKSVKCGAFVFDAYHLIEYLKEVIK